MIRSKRDALTEETNTGGEMYYQADICLMTEEYVNNDRNEGIDPKTTQDHGSIQSIKANDLETLKDKITRQFDISKFEAFEGRLEGGFDELADDRKTWVLNQYSIYIVEIRTKEVDAEFLKIA